MKVEVVLVHPWPHKHVGIECGIVEVCVHTLYPQWTTTVAILPELSNLEALSSQLIQHAKSV